MPKRKSSSDSPHDHERALIRARMSSGDVRAMRVLRDAIQAASHELDTLLVNSGASVEYRELLLFYGMIPRDEINELLQDGF